METEQPKYKKSARSASLNKPLQKVRITADCRFSFRMRANDGVFKADAAEQKVISLGGTGVYSCTVGEKDYITVRGGMFEGYLHKTIENAGENGMRTEGAGSIKSAIPPIRNSQTSTLSTHPQQPTNYHANSDPHTSTNPDAGPLTPDSRARMHPNDSDESQSSSRPVPSIVQSAGPHRLRPCQLRPSHQHQSRRRPIDT